MKIQFDLTLTGLIDVEVPDGTDLESMEPAEFSDFVSEFIDWHDVLNHLDTEIEQI